MPRFDHPDVRCRVRTFKEGVLSALAHDLLFEAASITLNIDEQRRVRAEVHGDDLRVVGAVIDGRLAPGKLDARDRREIEANLRDKVLDTRQHGAIRFLSEPVGSPPRALRGRLELHGHSRQLTLHFSQTGDGWRAELPVQQPDYGIKPFRAALGALRVRAEILVEIEVTKEVAQALGWNGNPFEMPVAVPGLGKAEE